MLINNTVFRKTMKNVRKQRDINQAYNKRSKKELFSIRTILSYYHTTKNISKDLLTREMKRMWMLLNKQVYLGLSIFRKSKIVMYEFLNNYTKPKYGKIGKLWYMDTDIFIVYIKTEDI